MSVLMASRKMYNACLEELITHYKQTGKYLHLYEQDKRHGSVAHPDLPAVVVDTTLKRLHRSFTNFFRGLKEGRKVGFPRFKNAQAWSTIQFRETPSRVLCRSKYQTRKQREEMGQFANQSKEYVHLKHTLPKPTTRKDGAEPKKRVWCLRRYIRPLANSTSP